MKVYKYDIVFQEVPGHLSLAFYVCGCPMGCKGCHSPELWVEKNGYPLSEKLFRELLSQYARQLSCVLFMGGEWHKKELLSFLKIARAHSLKTALYTGLENISPDLESELDFLKTGPWREELGGLWSPCTNQRFKDVRNNKILNHLFQPERTQP